MKILFVMPHFFGPAKGNYGSTRSTAETRIAAMTECLQTLWQNFGPDQGEIDIKNRRVIPANRQSASQMDVLICTTGENHLLKDLPVEAGMFRHYPVTIDPMLLGYACHVVLRENIGKYDYYCWIEDDILMQDPLFFQKIKLFSEDKDFRVLLQPNRYEVSAQGPYRKVYVDGDIKPQATSRFHNIEEDPVIEQTILGMPITFRRRLNPHAACFFLNEEQMRFWSEQPYFLDMDTSFIGPLESGADLGLMRSFKIYKPDRHCANFLEVRHMDNRFISLIRPESEMPPAKAAKKSAGKSKKAAVPTAK